MTAIIPAAGHGTRFLPVTRVVPKEMLPIGAKPALELIVEEAKDAGATDIVLVISPGKELIRSYFRDDPAIRFACQTEQKGLGHAVLQAKSVLDSSSFVSSSPLLILLGDALVAGCNASKGMLGVSRANGNCGVIGCERVPAEKVSRYGILDVREGRIASLVEKPTPEEAPSDIAVAGRYLLPPEIFSYLETQTPGKGGEIQLTDSIRRMISDGIEMRPHVYPGKRQDIGNPQGYFEALRAMGLNCAT